MGWCTTSDHDRFAAAAGGYLRSRAAENTMLLSAVAVGSGRPAHVVGQPSGPRPADGAAGAAVYLRDTLRGTTQPNRVTWLLWAVAPLLAAAVEFNEGVGLRALPTWVWPLLLVPSAERGFQAHTIRGVETT